MANMKQVYTNCWYKSYCFSNNYYSDDENDTELDPIIIYDEYSHREIIDRCDFGQNHMIHTRLSSNKFLIQEQVQTSIENNVLSSDPNNGNDGPSTQQTYITFPTMLNRGALIGGVNYEEIYMDSDLAIGTNPPITPNNPTDYQNPNTHKIPTLHETARKVARLEKWKLDEK